MCGIVGYKGSQNAIPVLISGLESLEYRGYDSAGVAFKSAKKVKIVKNIGKVSNLKNALKEGESSNVGIAHTRWATHGKVSTENSHPHKVGKITIVHNGIIENYADLKKELENEWYKFQSETDTEILCGLIDKIYQAEKSVLKALNKIKDLVHGSYALLVMCDDNLDELYGVRCNSPLIVAVKDDEFYLASDVPAILKYTNKYMLLDNNDIVKINDKLTFYNSNLEKITKEIKIFEGDSNDAIKNGYEHYMLKEINEEPVVVQNILNYYLTDGKFNSNMPDFKKYNKIFIVGCGSACYTADISKFLFEKYLNVPVSVYLASEYRYQKLFYDKDTLVIFISQSGETADTLEALRKTKEDGIDTLAIVNVVESSIAREADIALYIKAGVEIAVATTKAFTAQLTLLALLVLKMAGQEAELKYFYQVPSVLERILKMDYKKYAEKIYKHENAFFIGRQIDFGLCEEGSLKLKEISYINSSAFPSGELKHGTISLITENTPVISIVSDEDITLKTISNVKEVKARGAYSLCLTNQDIEGDFYDDKIVIENIHPIVNSILLVMPLQLLAYHVAYLRGLDIDKPRNLAKSVTVE
ncbi:MAG: glutamine--fructose-6-phosphate transaminase (isomerizing) [Firmicutes bacterium]|nr:glutamine--fructose-6-phosphate transaminase (isomerizing) [Bacillota bacterium]